MNLLQSESVLDLFSGGQLLGFSGLDGATDFSEGIVGRTAFDLIGFDIKLPGPCRLAFGATISGNVLLAGDFFEVTTERGSVRGAFLNAHSLLIEGPCLAENCSEKIVVLQEMNRTLVSSAVNHDPLLLHADLDGALHDRAAWLNAHPVPQGLSLSSRRAMAKAFSQMKTMVYSPEGIFNCRFTTPDRWPHRKTWLWDSAFHAIGMRHIDMSLARDAIDAVLCMQREDGMIPISSAPTNGTQKYTQPPVLCMAVSILDETEHDTLWLERIYPKLCAYIVWDMENRDSDGAGLVEWAIEGNAGCRSGESGWDNSPRFDSATQLDATDFNSFLAHECELLAGFAEQLGKSDDAATWRAHYERLCGLINSRLWNENEGIYVDFDVSIDAQSPVIAASGLLPLLCKAPDQRQAQLLAAHLANPKTFGTPFRVPTISASDIEHYRKDMWRGPVWINVNWMIARGLDRYGMHDLAKQIRSESCAEIERHYSAHGTLFEFFDDRKELPPPKLHRKGKLAPEISPYNQVFFDYGWTATLYVDMVMGLRS